MPAKLTFQEFRHQLDEITSCGSAEEDWWPAIEDLRKQYPHSIKRIERPSRRRFNCFMHGFRLEDSQRHYIINASTQPPIYADTCFVNFLLRRRLLIEHPADKRQDGDTLVYWNREFPVHAGRAASRRVHSKWGTGLMFDHEILEVPLSYGSIITCYEPVDVATAEQHFLEYARCMGYNPGAA